MSSSIYTKEVLSEVRKERERQDEKWGWPQEAMQTPAMAMVILGEEYGEACTEVVEMSASPSQSDFNFRRENLRTELIQTAAVAVSILEHMKLEDEK